VLDPAAPIWQGLISPPSTSPAYGVRALLSWLLRRVFPAKQADESADQIPRYFDEKRAKAIKQAALFEESHGAKGAPQCPRCGAEMTLEMAPSGSRFWGCTEYPTCKATRKA